MDRASSEHSDDFPPLVTASPQPIPTRITVRPPVYHTQQRALKGVGRSSLAGHRDHRYLCPLSQESVPLPTVPTDSAPVSVFLSTPSAFKERRGLGLIHLNIRSLLQQHKLDHLKILVSQAEPDVLVLSETWLKKSDNDSSAAIQQYNLYRCDRAGRGGGVAIYVKSCLSVSVLNAISIPKCFELLVLRIDLGPCASLVVIGVYKPPKSETHAIDSIMSTLSSYSNSEMIVLGDFNLDWRKTASSYLKEKSGNLGLTQLITECTRPNPTDYAKSSLIDLIFSNRTDRISASGVFDLGISDHCPTVCVRSTKLVKSRPRIVSRRNFKLFNPQAFLNDINASISPCLFESDDVQVVLDSFIKTFNCFVDKHAPVKRIRIKDRVAPWFNRELSALFTERNSSWSRAKRTGNTQDWLAFRQIRNRTTAAVRKAKSDYFLNLVANSQSNPAKFWSAVNLTKSNNSALPQSITVGDRKISDTQEICHAFNKHFIEAGHLFGRQSDGLAPLDPVSDLGLPRQHVSHFSFQPFSPSETLYILQSIDPKCATGVDNLDSFFIKLAAPAICEPLTHIFNLSIASGVVPQVWKSAKVAPIHKGGSREVMDNYRPISRLPCLAKVLETLVNGQLKYFLLNSSILSTHQSGFRANHSTTTAVTLVTNDITTALDSRKHCAVLFVDLSKAFDTVDHHLLLNSLSSIGLDRAACEWFQDYLSSRYQCVTSASLQSDFLSLTKGVPQGSVLGPVLFTIYINEILSSLTTVSGCKAHLYADDTIIYCVADTAHEAIASLQAAFDILQIALTNLKLVLNVSKTKYMLFSRAKANDHDLFRIATATGVCIEKVSEYKYLGIWLDDKLSFKFHVDNLATKLRQKIGFLYRNSASFPMPCRKRIVQAVFMSVLDYGDVVYRHASSTTLKPLDSAYHSALRFITGDKYDTHHCLLYDKVGWPSLTLRRSYHWYLFIYKAIIGKLPPYISSLLDWNTGMHQTRSSNRLALRVPRVRSEHGKSAFSYDAPHTWNALQQTLNLQAFPSLNEFKAIALDHCTSLCNCF